MLKYFCILILLLSSVTAFSQLPNKNTYLIAQVNSYPGYAGLWGYISPDNREYAILGCINGTSIVDITDSADIHEINFIPGFNSVYREIKTYSHYAYVVSEATNSKLQILDLQYLPDSVSLVATFAYPGFTRAHNISQSGPYLYLSGGNVCPNGGVQILELLNPVSPSVRGFNSVRYIHDSRIINDTIWAANILNQRVSLINATDKDNLPEIRSFVSLEPMPHNTALSSDRKYLFLTHENQDPPGSLEIWNVEDLENITYVNNWLPTGITTSVTHNIEVFGNLAIVAHYTAGVRILNISNPEIPVEVAWYDTRPQDNDNLFQGCWGVYRFPSGKIIASDISNGLFVIRADIPTEINSLNQSADNFMLHQNYPNPFNPETKISYSLNKLSKVKLSIYDVLGNEVSVLVNKKQNSGNYYVEWNAVNYPSGIYFYRIETDGYTESKKMTLLK